MHSVDDETTLCGLVHSPDGWAWYIGTERSEPYENRHLAMEGLVFALGYRRDRNDLGRWGMGADIVEGA